MPKRIQMNSASLQERFPETYREFFSLIFSDFGIATHYWQNFAMALLERLPAISLVLFLSCLLVFVGLLRHLLRDIKLILIIKQA